MPTITVDPSGALALLGDARKQLPYVLALAVNTVGEKAQAAERARIHGAFTLRRADFIDRESVKRLSPKPSKASPVFVLGPSERADFLAKFESNSEKVARSGGLIAIPVDVRRNKRDVITKANRPRALLSRKSAQVTPAGVGRIFIVKPGDPTLGTGPHLAPGIYQRLGSKQNASMKMLYTLKPRARILERLRLHDTVAKTVEAEWGAAVAEAVAKALDTAR